MSGAQAAMLRLLLRWEHLKLSREAGELVIECAEAYKGGLAWRIADTTLGACKRRGWITMDGDVAHLSEAGRAALAAVDLGRAR
jgi:hypothetical protein